MRLAKDECNEVRSVSRIIPGAQAKWDNKEIRDNIYKSMGHVKSDYLLPKK